MEANKIVLLKKPSKRILRIGGRQRRIEPGQYIAEIVEIIEGSFIGKRRTLEFHFRIAEGPFRDVVLNGFLNAHYEVFTEYSKLYQWYQKATGYSLNPDEEIDLEKFKDRLLKVEVDDKVSKKTKNVFSNVTAILELIKEF